MEIDGAKPMTRVHVLPLDDERKIVYCPDAMRFFVAKAGLIPLIRQVANGADLDDLNAKGFSITDRQLNGLREKLGGVHVRSVECPPAGQLPRLVLNISNDCNMRCKYCYANCGDYGGQRGLMSVDTLTRALDYFCSRYQEIAVIQLFGGEPTLNMPAIRLACEYFIDKRQNPKIGFVTNGVIVNDELLSLIKRFDLNVTVSIDGKSFQDRLRPFPGDSASWDRVHRNVLRLLEATGQPSQFELTYTQVHEDEQCSIVELIEELRKEFGDIPVHVTPVCSTDPQFELNSTQAFVDAVDDVYDARKDGKNDSFALLAGLESCLKYKVASEYLCNAGFGTLSVSTFGDIYPCFYFTDRAGYRAANVRDEFDSIDLALRRMREKYSAMRKRALPECTRCFANTVCHSCLGANLDTTGDPFRSSVSSCAMTRKMLERLLVRLALCVEKEG